MIWNHNRTWGVTSRAEPPSAAFYLLLPDDPAGCSSDDVRRRLGQLSAVPPGHHAQERTPARPCEGHVRHPPFRDQQAQLRGGRQRAVAHGHAGGFLRHARAGGAADPLPERRKKRQPDDGRHGGLLSQDRGHHQWHRQVHGTSFLFANAPERADQLPGLQAGAVRRAQIGIHRRGRDAAVGAFRAGHHVLPYPSPKWRRCRRAASDDPTGQRQGKIHDAQLHDGRQRVLRHTRRSKSAGGLLGQRESFRPGAVRALRRPG